MKRCPDCEVIKSLTEFGKDKSAFKGIGTRCKECNVKHVAKHRGDKPLEERRLFRLNQHYKIMYGITLDQANKILADQGNKCRACNSSDPRSGTGRFDLDHDHRTNKVRGFLCHACNVALGQVDDSIDRLKALIHYLEYNLSTNTRQG